MGARKEAASTMSFVELLYQDRWWRTADGSVVRVDRMAQSHRLSTLALLERKAPAVALAISRGLMREAWSAACLPAPTADMAHDRYEAEIDALDREATEWRDFPLIRMRRTPLYRALMDQCTRAMMDQ